MSEPRAARTPVASTMADEHYVRLHLEYTYPQDSEYCPIIGGRFRLCDCNMKSTKELLAMLRDHLNAPGANDGVEPYRVSDEAWQRVVNQPYCDAYVNRSSDDHFEWPYPTEPLMMEHLTEVLFYEGEDRCPGRCGRMCRSCFKENARCCFPEGHDGAHICERGHCVPDRCMWFSVGPAPLSPPAQVRRELSATP